MSEITIDAIQDDDIVSESFDIARVRLSDLPPEKAALIEKTAHASREAIAKTEYPELPNILSAASGSSLKPTAITYPPENQGTVTSAAAHVGIVSPNRRFLPPEEQVRKLLDARGVETSEELQQVNREIENTRDRVNGLTLGDPIEETPDDLVENALVPPEVSQDQPNFPNLAYEVVKLGLKMQAFQTQNKLNAYTKEGHQHKATIEQLLKLNAHIQKLPTDSAPHPVTQEVRDMISQLKDRGIDLFPGLTDKFTKEQLIGGKSLIGSHIDQLRLKLQDLFSTKISTTVQFLNSMIDIMKNVIRSHERLMSTISRHSGAGG